MRLRLLIIAALLATAHVAFAGPKKDTLTFAFYNLENLFDVQDDPAKDDAEFLPSAKKQWDQARLDKKYKNLADVVSEMNNKRGPDILGMAEVENRGVLEVWNKNYLSSFNFGLAHRESPDERGIDVAIFYKKARFTEKEILVDTVKLPAGWPTRLILHAVLKDKSGELFHIFANHWPSRRGGEKESEINRKTAALTLLAAVNKVVAADAAANIIIFGDFNDEPTNVSILDDLGAKPLYCPDSLAKTSKDAALFNLAYAPKEAGVGSFKYRDSWNMLDQIIVSRSLISGKNTGYVCGSFAVFKPAFIVQQGGRYDGAPFPTYGGDRYLGGYSDHFPVLAKFVVAKGKKK